MTNGNGLAAVDHVVVLMLENRSCRTRTDDVLAGVTVPVSSGPGPAVGTVSHLEEVRAELISRRFPAGVTAPPPPGPLSA